MKHVTQSCTHHYVMEKQTTTDCNFINEMTDSSDPYIGRLSSPLQTCIGVTFGRQPW